MAVTENLYTGDGSTVLYSFTFPYLEESDIFVSVDGTDTTAYTLPNPTTISFNTAPANGASIRIYRSTNIDALDAEFYPGSSIRAQDLNGNFDQTLYVVQEVQNYTVQDTGDATLSGTYTFNGNINVPTPVDPSNAVTKAYADNLATAAGQLTSGDKGDITVSSDLLTWTLNPFLQSGTGATPRTIESKLRDVVSVKDFGAVGDGVADDTDAIQAAINSAVSQNIKSIYAPIAFIKISSAVDAQGIGIIGTNTEIIDTANFSNLGPLVNCIVRGFRTDVDYYDSLSTAGSSKKIAYRKESGCLSILTKRIGKGFVESEHRYNNFGSNPTDAGGSCENWRQCITRLISEIYTYKKTSSAETAAAWGVETPILVSQSFPTGTASAIQLNYRSTNTLNAEITWDVNSTVIGKVGYAAVYATAGSAGTVELYVNGVLQTTFSATLVGTNYIVPVRYELNLVGVNTVTLKKTGGGSLNVIGVEFTTLENLEDSSNIDSIAYGDWGEDYVSSNGASDYALFSPADGKFFGSVHGGETERIAAIFKVDGDVTTIPASVGDFVIGTTFNLEQNTTIAVGSNSLDVDSTYLYDADSVVEFYCYMSGSAVVNDFFTAMSAATTRFAGIKYPIFNEALPTGKNTLGRFNTVTQINRADPNFPLDLTVQFTLFPMGGDTGANMGSNGPFIATNISSQSKLYYGPVLDSDTTITEISYKTVRKFH